MLHRIQDYTESDCKAALKSPWKSEAEKEQIKYQLSRLRGLRYYRIN